MSEYEVHALWYGRRTGTRGQHFLGCAAGEAEQPHPTAYYVWLARSAEHTVLIDAGIHPSRVPSGLAYRRPAEVLASIGVAAGDVDLVVLTHLHYDHAGTVADFPAARWSTSEATGCPKWTATRRSRPG